mgnify:CR=1 FL=1
MKEQYQKIIESTGEDVTRAGLLDTPDRASKAFAYLTSGYKMDLNAVINDALFAEKVNLSCFVKSYFNSYLLVQLKFFRTVGSNSGASESAKFLFLL